MTATLEHPALIRRLTPREMISPQLWDRLTGRIVKDHPEHSPEMADRILDQTLIFLYLSAIDPDHRHTPSDAVDVGWHTFLLYTREYAEFCERVAGRFLHHAPSDVPGAARATGGVAATVAALRARHLPVDETLWVHAVGNSDFCDDKCSDGGNCQVAGPPSNPPKTATV